MAELETFKFDKSDSEKIRKYKFGQNWPAVYIIEDGKEIYIGETTSVVTRAKQHLENPDRTRLKNIHIISDDEFNKSATLDMESRVIKYI
jgi:predicted GIY-YIG superfamily endonuclease